MKKKSNHKSRKELEARKVANNIEKLMAKLGYSRYSLAKKAGISRSTIAEFLDGITYGIEWYNLYKIAEALNTTMDGLRMGAKVEIIDNPEVRKIISSLPPEAKVFFSSPDHISKQEYDLIIRNIKLILERHGLDLKERK